MEDSIFAGDVILISKLNYGPKLPQTPFDIPWVNLWFYHTSNENRANSTEWNYRRLGGFSSVRRGDVFVFKKYNSHEKMIIKRCAGLPGESIKIINGTVLINNVIINLAPSIKRNYSLRINDKLKFEQTADSLKLAYTIDRIGTQYSSEININDKQKDILEKSGSIAQFLFIPSKEKAFPQEDFYNWTVDFMGPIIIPYKGLKILLDRKNFLLYKSLILQEGAKSIDFKESVCYIDGLPVKDYAFSKNYYFVLGDNVANSLDSRFWGVVSESAIEGRAVCSFFTKNESNRKVLIKLL